MDGIVIHSSNDAIAYPSHVRSIGAVIAPRKYVNMKRKPRGWTGRTTATQCISIMPDGTRTVFAPAKKQSTNIAGVKRQRRNTAAIMQNAIDAHNAGKSFAKDFAPIGDVD